MFGVAGVVAWQMNRGVAAPGKGKPCEIVLIDTGERIPTTWDHIWPMKPIQSPVNGYWLVEYPKGSQKYGYIVEPGAQPPKIETQPAGQ